MSLRPMSALCALVTAALVAATGCAKKPVPPVALPPPSTLDLVSEHGELRVCGTGDYRPFSYRDPGTGRWSGTDVDLAGDLAGRLGVRLTLVPTTWAGMVDDLTAGRCDIVMGGVPVSLERARRASFSQPYLADGKVPLVRCPEVARFAGFEQIDQPGVRVLLGQGGPHDGFPRERIRRAAVLAAPDQRPPADQLLAGRADVLITEASQARWQARQHPGQLCPVSPERPLVVAYKAYLLPRGDVLFQQYVDLWLRTAQADGTFNRVNRPATG